MDKSICTHAHEIMFERREEKERQYGEYVQSMERAADIFAGMTGTRLTARQMNLAILSIKLSRIDNQKYDTNLDAISYIAGLELIDESQKKR